ncbi:MAG TPA: tetratricopeptide repeat protein, partial [Bryobacteraceae bacterium]|nr:tetratricopeptide repeat protein [Bryobacteraceae bacterium]
KEVNSSLSLSKVRSGLIARGLRDAAVLVKPLVPEPTDWFSETHRRAEEGDVGAQWDLAVAYFAGDSRLDRALVNSGEWVHWMRKLADQNDDGAQAWLGEAYEWGIDVPQNYAESVRWYRKAAEQGNPGAQNRLGNAYKDGKGVAQDYIEAAHWYRKAAEHGDAHAQHNLGAAYYYGQGVAQGYAEAVRWLRNASGSRYDLGQDCKIGRGVSKDYVLAHVHYNLAASNSSGEDRERRAKARDDIEKKLTPQQLAEAQQIARDCQPKQ